MALTHSRNSTFSLAFTPEGTNGRIDCSAGWLGQPVVDRYANYAVRGQET
jgi:hypothetical protein